MSCQIRLTANIQDVHAIRRCLFPTDDLRGSDSWLQLCEVSVSPTGDIIAIANERRIVVLTSKWDSNLDLSQFQITYSGSIHEYDKVKAVLCLPIVGQSQSSHVCTVFSLNLKYVGPDWTCILIGFDSGYVRFYTENCELLLEEQLHSENICNIKCQSQHSPRPDISPDLHQEEVYVQYQSNVCVLKGSQLFMNLRTCRSQLARVQAKGNLLDTTQTTINPRKWGFQDQSVVNDSAVVGLNLCSTFDHLLTASTCGGFDTKYRAMPPHNTLVLSAGSKPFVGYHYALEGGPQAAFGDVAKAVASKLKSALPGWLVGGKTQAEKQMTVAMQPVDTMGCRFGLCDLRRTSTDIVMSPDHKLAAVCDTLGRVLLIDSYRGIVLRIFKGYRDAQCSFVQVPDEKKSKHRRGDRVALFLVIYSSKKGTVEIFTVQQGMKVTTFTASKFSRLLYINYGLMGFTTTSKSRYICQFTTVFIDNDGQIKEIMVPFHFALSEKNNKRARDIHVYKKLRTFIKSGDFDPEQIETEAYATCSELKTLEMKLQTIEMLMNSKDIPATTTLRCVEYFVEQLKEESDPEYNNFRVLVENATGLLKFYLYVTKATRGDLDVTNGDLYEANGNLKNSEESVDTDINLGAKALINLQKLLDLNTLNDTQKSEELKVSFADTKDFSVADFLSIFNITQASQVTLKPNMDGSLLFKASELIFTPYIVGDNKAVDDLQVEITKSRIVIKDLFAVLINYWVNRSLYNHLNLEKEMNNLSALIYSLAKSTVEHDDVIVDYNNISRFWSEIREILTNSARPFPAVTAAILCKNIVQKLEQEVNLTSLEDENIEVLSQENCKWALLIGKLEDVSMLNIILSNKPNASDCPLPKLNHDKIDISLRYILQKGKGSVSELVAQWLSLGGINPELININEYVYKKSNEQTDASSLPEYDPKFADWYEVFPLERQAHVKTQPVFDHINLLKVQFPYSLEGSALLTNMSWEYAVAWKKDIQNLNVLEASIKCLSYISNLHIKKGLCSLLWHTHLKILFESVCRLLNKVGKLPKERLCRQDTGLSDYQITIFSGICTNFLDSYMDTVQQSHKAPNVPLHFENIWENGPQPLIELALQQREISYDLLHLHYLLSVALQMLASFGTIKHSKPFNNLFDAYCSNLFFVDFHKKAEINWNKSDIRIQEFRTQFLLKVIKASIETVVKTENKTYVSEHVIWMNRCMSIGRLWNLNEDVLRQFQLVQLFINGFDSIAQEMVSCVIDLNKIGHELLKIAGSRLKMYMASLPDLSSNITALSTSVTRYIEPLELNCVPSSLSEIRTLAKYAAHSLGVNQYEHKLALLIVEACTELAENQSFKNR